MATTITHLTATIMPMIARLVNAPQNLNCFFIHFCLDGAKMTHVIILQDFQHLESISQLKSGFEMTDGRTWQAWLGEDIRGVLIALGDVE
jgi:hypothetical protein